MNPKPSQTHKPITQTGTDEPAAAFYPVPGAGTLRIAGADQGDFLQRQTTNDLGLLTDSLPLVTVLTTPAARILDVLTLFKSTNQESGEDELLALTLPGRAEATAAYLKSKIFFMDNVTVADVSPKYRQIEVYDAGLPSWYGSLGFMDQGDLPSIDRATFDDAPISLLRQELLPPRLVMSASMEAPITSHLQTLGMRELSPEEYELFRVEAGRPGPLAELTDDYTPLENNMNWTISATKGCYTGQEVIARQITYDKVTRKLVGIQLAAKVTTGSKVWAGKQAAGTVTSTVLSSRFGPIALAMIKRPHYEIGADVVIGDKETGTPGTITELPFSQDN